MAAIAGVYLTRTTQLAPYQYSGINEVLAQIFDASTECGAGSYGLVHGRVAGKSISATRAAGKFDSKRVTDAWADKDTRCIIASFVPTPANAQPAELDGVVVTHTGKIENAREILGRRFGKVPSGTAIAQALAGEPWDTPQFAINNLKGSVAFAAYDGARGSLLLFRDYQPLSVYYHAEWGAYFFASRDSYVPSQRLIRLGLDPYVGVLFSAGDIMSFDMPKTVNKKGAVIFDGSSDSVLLATLAAAECADLTLLHFDYEHEAQKQEKATIEALLPELQHMTPRCHFFLQTIPLGFLKDIGAIVATARDEELSVGDPGPVFEWIPARNTVLASLAAAFCESHEVSSIYLGMNLDGIGETADSTWDFVDSFSEVLDCATRIRPTLKVPLATMSKKDIIEKSLALKAPVELSRDCPEGGSLHCGRCRACKSRQSAFALLGVEDQTEYES